MPDSNCIENDITAWHNVDTEMTPMRSAVMALQQCLQIGADETFDCQYFCACRKSKSKRSTEFSRGDWTYVGHKYGKAKVNGKCAKILFVAMERPKCSTESETFECTQRDFRESCLKRTNPHMGGVDVLLEALLDESTRCEDRCQVFALTNSVRCRPVTDNAMSNSTRTMMKNCQNHTGELIKKLEPNIIVTQGIRFPREQIRTLFKLNGRIFKTENGKKGGQKRYAEVYHEKGKGIMFLLTAHPANHPEFLTSREKGSLPDHLLRAIGKVRALYTQ